MGKPGQVRDRTSGSPSSPRRIGGGPKGVGAWPHVLTFISVFSLTLQVWTLSSSAGDRTFDWFVCILGARVRRTIIDLTLYGGYLTLLSPQELIR